MAEAVQPTILLHKSQEDGELFCREERICGTLSIFDFSFKTWGEGYSEERIQILPRKLHQVGEGGGIKIHKVNLFFCSRPYVTFCAKQRQGATNEADKRLWKLMANIIYGMYITYVWFSALL